MLKKLSEQKEYLDAEGVPSRKALMRKQDEIIDVLNAWTAEEETETPAPVETPPEQTATAEPATATNTVAMGAEISKGASPENTFEGWAPVGGKPDATYFMPPKNYVDPADGTPIAGMVPRNQLPQPVLAHYNALSQSNG